MGGTNAKSAKMLNLTTGFRNGWTRMDRTRKVSVIGLGLLMTGFGFYLLNLCTWSYGTLCVSRGDAIPVFIHTNSGSLILGTRILWLLRPCGTLASPRIEVS